MPAGALVVFIEPCQNRNSGRARGEFSIVIAGLGAAVEPQLGPLGCLCPVSRYTRTSHTCGELGNRPGTRSALERVIQNGCESRVEVRQPIFAVHWFNQPEVTANGSIQTRSKLLSVAQDGDGSPRGKARLCFSVKSR